MDSLTFLVAVVDGAGPPKEGRGGGLRAYYLFIYCEEKGGSFVMLNRIRASKQNGLCACGGVAHPRRRKFGLLSHPQ